jgi:hypothetical protein
MVLEPLSSLRLGSMHKPIKVATGHSLGCQKWANRIRLPMRTLGHKMG